MPRQTALYKPWNEGASFKTKIASIYYSSKKIKYMCVQVSCGIIWLFTIFPCNAFDCIVWIIKHTAWNPKFFELVQIASSQLTGQINLLYLRSCLVSILGFYYFKSVLAKHKVILIQEWFHLHILYVRYSHCTNKGGTVQFHLHPQWLSM